MSDSDLDLFDFLEQLDQESPKNQGQSCLVVPECDSTQELIAFVDELHRRLQDSPDRLTLRFMGVHEMYPDPALLVYETLLHRSPATQITTDACSPLIGCSILVWLAGDYRRLRPTAWMFFRRNAKKRPRHPFEDNAWQETSDEFSPLETDYRTVLKLMGRHMPVAEFAGKIITPAILNEFCLLHEPDPVEKSTSQDPSRRDPKQCEEIRKSKRIWFIRKNDQGGYTLHGGWPAAAMKKDPNLRPMDIGFNFPTKEALLKHTDAMNFCPDNNAIIVDNGKIVRDGEK
jgi:hypothetical protein